MQKVVCTQAIFANTAFNGIRKHPHILTNEVAVIVGADTHRIENRRDARCCNLRIMGLNRSVDIPAHFRTRRVMAFELVGVQLDEARNDIIAIHVIAAIGIALIDGCNFAVTDQDRTGNNLVSEHDLRIFQNDFISHWRALS